MLSSRQAAHRLGVKVETLYAYVSRGLLTSHRDEAHRASVFDEREVERLARRGRPRAASRTPTLDIDIATAITSTHTPTGGYEVRFRGHPAAELAATVAFEQVAELLWTGELTASPAPPWAGWPLRHLIGRPSHSAEPRLAAAWPRVTGPPRLPSS